MINFKNQKQNNRGIRILYNLMKGSRKIEKINLFQKNIIYISLYLMYTDFSIFVKQFSEKHKSDDRYINTTSVKILENLFQSNDFNLKDIKYCKICKIMLNQLKYPKYSKKNIPQIYAKITGRKDLYISEKNIQKIVKCFNSSEFTFNKYNQYIKSIFFPYALYKICELIELHEFTNSFDIKNFFGLRILENLDEKWKKICEELRWQFIATIFSNKHNSLFLQKNIAEFRHNNEEKINKKINNEISKECCICFDVPENFFRLHPCGHEEFCKKCIDKMNLKQCPICRQLIENI